MREIINNGKKLSEQETVFLGLYETLLTSARQICNEQGIDFDRLISQEKRAILCYWCSICGKTHPLTDILLRRRRKICCVCNNNVKLYSSSNKFGKIRKKIFYRYTEIMSNGIEARMLNS